MLLINKVLTLWTICCILLFSQIPQSNGIIISNWLIVLIPVCFVDFILLITIILFMSGRLPEIFGDCDAGSKLNQTLTLCFILWKLAGQIVLCLYFEGYIDGLFYKVFQQANSKNVQSKVYFNFVESISLGSKQHSPLEQSRFNYQQIQIKCRGF
nr:unnamed protein product [Trichobilharzia regenti]